MPVDEAAFVQNAADDRQALELASIPAINNAVMVEVCNTAPPIRMRVIIASVLQSTAANKASPSPASLRKLNPIPVENAQGKSTHSCRERLDAGELDTRSTGGV